MIELKSCVGCKHLAGCWCHQNTLTEYKIDPYTKRSGRVYVRQPILVKQARSEDGPCKPERFLFEPTWRHTFWNWVRRKNK